MTRVVWAQTRPLRLHVLVVSATRFDGSAHLCVLDVHGLLLTKTDNIA